MILRKPHVLEKSGSQEMTPKVWEKCQNWTKNVGFQVFIKIWCIDVYVFLLKMMQHNVLRNAVKTACSGKVWFSRYGPQNFGKSAKIGIKMWVFKFLSKSGALMCMFFA